MKKSNQIEFTRGTFFASRHPMNRIFNHKRTHFVYVKTLNKMGCYLVVFKKVIVETFTLILPVPYENLSLCKDYNLLYFYDFS